MIHLRQIWVAQSVGFIRLHAAVVKARCTPRVSAVVLVSSFLSCSSQQHGGPSVDIQCKDAVKAIPFAARPRDVSVLALGPETLHRVVPKQVVESRDNEQNASKKPDARRYF